MVSKKYFFVSSTLFALVALVHILILISDWSYKIENFVIPDFASLLAAIIMGFMSYKSFYYWHKG